MTSALNFLRPARWRQRIYDWLARADPVTEADVIFTLAGRQSRKLFGLQLLAQGMTHILVLSVGRFEIRRFAQLPWPTPLDLAALASSIPAGQRHFFVVLESDTTALRHVVRGRFGTLSEIRAFADWLRGHPEVRSLLLISSAPHLRRLRLCCRVLLPAHFQVRYSAVLDDGSLNRDRWWSTPRGRKIVLAEFPKLLVYRLLLMSH